MPFVGRNNSHSTGFEEHGAYDANRFNYGGRAGGAAYENANIRNRQQKIEERAAPQMQGTSMQGSQLNQGAANQTRDIQMGSLAGLSAAASGATPSKAEILTRQAGDRAARGMVSAAGTVRGGPGAQAAAYRSAQQGAAQQAADIAATAGATRADEMATARGQLANAATGTRGQDLSAATTDATLAQDTAKTNATLAQDTNKANLGAGLQTMGMNDARAAQYEQLQQDINRSQLDANVAQQKVLAGSRQQADTLNTQTNQANADKDMDLFKGAVGLGVGVLQGGAKLLSDPATKMPIMGSLAELGLGGERGPGGTVDIGGKGFASSSDIQRASAGSDAGFGMVGGGGLTGGGGTPGGFMSDEKAKEPPQTWGEDEDRSSPTFRGWLSRSSKGAPEKDVNPGKAITSGDTRKRERTWLDDIDDETKDARPFDRDAEIGKPKAKDAALERGMAPGTDDWNKHGGGEKYVAPEGQPGVFEALFGGMNDGIKGWVGSGVPRSTITSDPKAKTAAFEDGVAYADSLAAGSPQKPPSYYKSDKPEYKKGDDDAALKSRIKAYDEESKRLHGPPQPYVSNLTADQKARMIAASAPPPPSPFLGATATGAGPTAPPPAAPQQPPPQQPAIAMSDERTKEGFAKPSTEDMADAMRSMDPAVYAYKPSYKPDDQTPGEVNIGPMANKMAQDPVARTAIVRDDESGMLALDRTKLEKITAGSLAALQSQIDELQGDVPRGDAKKQRRRAPAHA